MVSVFFFLSFPIFVNTTSETKLEGISQIWPKSPCGLKEELIRILVVNLTSQNPDFDHNTVEQNNLIHMLIMTKFH